MSANLKKLINSSAIALATATALSLAAIAPSYAADDLYDPGVTHVEFGTGWYIRGEIGASFLQDFREIESSTPINGTNVQLIEEEDTSAVFNFGVAVGHRFTNNLRGDIGYSYLADSSRSSRSSVPGTTGAPCSTGEVFESPGTDQNGNVIPPQFSPQVIDNCVQKDETEYFLQSLIATGYYDLDTSVAGLRPFIGIGGGIIRNQFQAEFGSLTCTPSVDERCGATDGGNPGLGEVYTQSGTRTNGTSYHLAGTLTAGLSYALTDTLFLDTSYRYTHMFDDPIFGGTNGVDAAGVPTDFHTVTVGLRMEIW
ncbi:MAG: outer membrane beta-barrel protein [Ahrensia sp.]|nr:outer membrane beta-barrel protein [Ahrensia sp.]